LTGRRAVRPCSGPGLSPQKIFEETGFEPIQQNQIVVAEQVYQSIMKAGVDEATRSHFTQRGSDLLYELRIPFPGPTGPVPPSLPLNMG
jgi:hypothetical protein